MESWLLPHREVVKMILRTNQKGKVLKLTAGEIRRCHPIGRGYVRPFFVKSKLPRRRCKSKGRATIPIKIPRVSSFVPLIRSVNVRIQRGYEAIVDLVPLFIRSWLLTKNSLLIGEKNGEIIVYLLINTLRSKIFDRGRENDGAELVPIGR